MYRKILEMNTNYQFDSDSQMKLNDINIFVGRNNSGKSRFMRWIATSSDKIIIEKHGYIDLIAIGNTLQIKLNNNPAYNQFKKLEVNFDESFLKINFDKINEYVNIVKPANTFFSRIYKRYEFESQKNGSYSSLSHNFNTMQNLIRNIDSEYQTFSQLNLENPEIKKFYIPILRGLRPFNLTSDLNEMDLYKNRTLKDYKDISLVNPDKPAKAHVITGLDFYDTIRNHLLGNLDERELIRDYEDFLAKYIFNVEKVALIPQVRTDVLVIKIGDDREREVFNLGEGVQAIINLTYPLFMNKNEYTLFLIEEPEIFMHPGLQRIFLQTISNKEIFPKMQVILTTHSNHILEIFHEFDGISVFSFDRISDGKFRITDAAPRKHMLDLLGVRNSSVFLTNCIIWVEGISDRIYIRKYLQLYLEHLKLSHKYFEDYHYSFIEYAGNNITHFNFHDDLINEKITASSINLSNFVIADHDGNYTKENGFKNSQKGIRLETLKSILGENFYFDHYEIENTLTEEILRAYIADLCQQKKKDWSYKDKTKGSRPVELSKEKIGVQISKYMIKHPEDRTIDYLKNKDITVLGENKVDIAEGIISIMDNKLHTRFEDLSESAKTLTKAVFNFIEKNN